MSMLPKPDCRIEGNIKMYGPRPEAKIPSEEEITKALKKGVLEQCSEEELRAELERRTLANSKQRADLETIFESAKARTRLHKTSNEYLYSLEQIIKMLKEELEEAGFTWE